MGGVGFGWGGVGRWWDGAVVRGGGLMGSSGVCCHGVEWAGVARGGVDLKSANGKVAARK